MSRLEEFINNNRDAFDEEMPSQQVWKKVEVFIPAKQKTVFYMRPIIRWSIAASILMVIGATVLLMTRKPNVPEINTVKTTADTSTSDIAAVLPEAAPEVSEFAKLIALKQEELKALSKEQPELYQKFTSDINQLDSSYRTLKNQLSMAPNKEMLIEAMVQNLQLQLNVLNQQLNIINQIKHSKKYSHEKNKSFT
jgi:hypothetical protein